MPALQVSKAPPDLCRRKPKCLLQNNSPISQASNPSQWALPFPSHLAWCVRPTTPHNHLVNVEKGKAEWLTLRSNVGGHQDSRFISRKSLAAPLSVNSSSCSTGVRGQQAATMQQDGSIQILMTISTLFFQTCKVFAVLSVTITSYKALLRRQNNRGASETW